MSRRNLAIDRHLRLPSLLPLGPLAGGCSFCTCIIGLGKARDCQLTDTWGVRYATGAWQVAPRSPLTYLANVGVDESA